MFYSVSSQDGLTTVGSSLACCGLLPSPSSHLAMKSLMWVSWPVSFSTTVMCWLPTIPWTRQFGAKKAICGWSSISSFTSW